MTRHSFEQLHRIAESLSSQGEMALASQLLLIRSIRQSRNEEPCFATDQNYCCGKDCEWRKDCRDMMALWLS